MTTSAVCTSRVCATSASSLKSSTWSWGGRSSVPSKFYPGLVNNSRLWLENQALKRGHSRHFIVSPVAVLSPERLGTRNWEEMVVDGQAPMAMTGLKVGDDLPANYAVDDPNRTKPERRCGILLHPSSMPGPNGIGELGEEAFEFLDWLSSTGCTVCQVLPLVPPGRKGGEDGSPYAEVDANCGNTQLISLQELVKDGLLEDADLPAPVPLGRMNFDAVATLKDPLIAKAAKNLVNSTGTLRKELDRFHQDPRISSWLEEAALFAIH